MADQICPDTRREVFSRERAMRVSDHIDERERALRKELSRRTLSMPSRNARDEDLDTDPEHIKEIGSEISYLIREERLEEAGERLDSAIEQYPNEPGLLNLQFALNMMLRPSGSYDKAKESTRRAMELGIERGSTYFARVALNNMGLAAQKEGHEEFSLAMYLAAHFIDQAAVLPIADIAGWYSRKGELEKSQKWIEKLLKISPDWNQNEEIKTFLLKDEMLRNLRTYAPFREKVLKRIDDGK